MEHSSEMAKVNTLLDEIDIRVGEIHKINSYLDEILARVREIRARLNGGFRQGCEEHGVKCVHGCEYRESVNVFWDDEKRKIREKYFLKNGKKDGEYVSFYENGDHMEVSTYAKGILLHQQKYHSCGIYHSTVF